MRKLALNLDDLAVESFATEPDNQLMIGTVRGNGNSEIATFCCTFDAKCLVGTADAACGGGESPNCTALWGGCTEFPCDSGGANTCFPCTDQTCGQYETADMWCQCSNTVYTENPDCPTQQGQPCCYLLTVG